ncbi:hypothetical protein ACFWCB_18790 [Streptomyces sp. NPDC060048]|uniref:hypothetical protein n=1 Tax=unclassified Streptomyces TaxID=2593676 RepID=UPI003687E1D1
MERSTLNQDGLSRLCLFVDVQGYGQRTLPEQERVQRWLVEALERMRENALLDEGQLVRQNQGDGCLLLVDPWLPVPAVLPRLVQGITEAVHWINEPLRESTRIKVRVAFDVGVVRTAANGYVGRAVTSVARLVDSALLKSELAASAASEVAVVLSDSLYQDVVATGLPGLPPESFEQIPVEVKEFATWAWLMGRNRTGDAAGSRGAGRSTGR